MNLEIGKYVRYTRSMINGNVAARIAKIVDCSDNELIKIDNGRCILREDVIKASYNLIDLIEVGDYVNGGYVLDFETLQTGEKTAIVDGLINYGWGQGVIPVSEIKSIVTKEQFESMKYEVKENE